MANEAVIIELLGEPKGCAVRGAIPDASAVAKGELMFWDDGRTLSGANAGTSLPFAGIAASEKVASDGQTSLGVWTKGLFDLRTSGGDVTPGQLVKISGSNLIAAAAATDVENGYIVGKALETAADGAAETIAVAVGIY